MQLEEKVYLNKLFENNSLNERRLPNKKKVENWIEKFYAWLFGIQNDYHDFDLFVNEEEELKQALEQLLEQLNIDNSKATAQSFFEDLLSIQDSLLSDLETVLEFDPAAKNKEEVLLAYPGFFAVAVYRVANNLWKRKIRIIPRVLSEYGHSKTGIDIHPAATIGHHFFIDHGTGVVIGETAKIGNHVKIYQGVTLGALSVHKDKAEKKRHPSIEDHVIIYANATILGGNTIIGAHSVIGGNVWITESIPPKSLVYHRNEIIIKTKIEVKDIIDFNI